MEQCCGAGIVLALLLLELMTSRPMEEEDTHTITMVTLRVHRAHQRRHRWRALHMAWRCGGPSSSTKPPSCPPSLVGEVGGREVGGGGGEGEGGLLVAEMLTPGGSQWRTHWQQAVFFFSHPHDCIPGRPITVHAHRDDYTFWFSDPGDGPSPDPPPRCVAGAHSLCSPARLGHLACLDFTEFVMASSSPDARTLREATRLAVVGTAGAICIR
jgi:hypothetical protein